MPGEMIFQIISIICNLIALILLIICYRLHKTFLEDAIHREELLLFLKVVQKELRKKNNATCKYFKDKGKTKDAIEWQYYTGGNDNAINYIKSFIKDGKPLREYINHFLERDKSENN